MRFPWTTRAALLAVMSVCILFSHSQIAVRAQSPSTGSEGASGLSYPAAKKTDQLDDYHGVKVADPYRWLEDLDSAETRNWVEAENQLSFSYLKGIPERDRIKDRLTKLWNYERYGIPFKRGAYYFYSRNNGLQNQSVL